MKWKFDLLVECEGGGMGRCVDASEHLKRKISQVLEFWNDIQQMLRCISLHGL